MSRICYETDCERFAVVTSCAKMPTSCWGRYLHVGLVELDRVRIADEPDSRWTITLTDRARAVIEVLVVHRACHAGEMVRSEARRSLDELIELADRVALDRQLTDALVDVTRSLNERVTDWDPIPRPRPLRCRDFR